MKQKSAAAVIIVCLILALTESGSAQGESPANVLVGLWGVEQNLGPRVRGELTVDARRPEWRALIGGYDVPVDHKDGAVSFNLPGDAGALRAHLSADARSIVGHVQEGQEGVYH